MCFKLFEARIVGRTINNNGVRIKNLYKFIQAAFKAYTVFVFTRAAANGAASNNTVLPTIDSMLFVYDFGISFIVKNVSEYAIM